MAENSKRSEKVYQQISSLKDKNNVLLPSKSVKRSRSGMNPRLYQILNGPL